LFKPNGRIMPANWCCSRAVAWVARSSFWRVVGLGDGRLVLIRGLAEQRVLLNGGQAAGETGKSFVETGEGGAVLSVLPSSATASKIG
jgi:hypothetical protein